MKNKNHTKENDLYTEELSTVCDVHFTPREIDIIACLICSRGTNKIASFLSILPKTVRNHIHNIMIKLNCNSRDSIIDFIERSDKVPLLRLHYSKLLIRADFDKSLQEIARLIRGKEEVCKIISWKTNEGNHSLRDFIQAAFKKLGIKVFFEERETKTLLTELKNESHEDTDILIFILQEVTEDEVQTLYYAQNKISKQTSYFCTNNSFTDDVSSAEETQLILLDSYKDNYYFLTFEIIKTKYYQMNLEKIISGFKEKYKIRSDGYNTQSIKVQDENNPLKGKILYFNSLRKIKLFVTMGAFVCLILGASLYYTIKTTQSLKEVENVNLGFQNVDERQKFEEQRINLRYIPALPNHFDRELIHHKALNEKFGGLTKPSQKGVEIFAIVGVAGSGKTTSALWYAGEYDKSFYAHQGMNKRHTVIFKLNAENIEELNASYGDLAKRLGVDTKQSLDAIIKEVDIKLEQYPGWLLIFDNIQNESYYMMVKKYIPEKRIGLEGKIIITSQDLNLNFDSTHLVNISEGAPEEAAALFLQNQTKMNDKESASKLVKELDRLPLSLAVAALYIKKENENVKKGKAQFSLDDYHKRIVKSAEDHGQLEKVQARLLEAENMGYREPYNLTQSVILRLAIENLKKDSQKLLSLCGFISPDRINKTLLTAYLSKIKKISYKVAEEQIEPLICDINKHGLLYPIDEKSFSIHRATQKEIIKFYLEKLNAENRKKAIHAVLRDLNECATSDENEKTLRHINLTELQHHLALHLERFKNNLELYDVNLSMFGELGIRTLINIGVGYKDLGVGLEEINISKRYLQEALDMSVNQVKSPYYFSKAKYELAIVKREVNEIFDLNGEAGAITLFKSALKALNQDAFSRDKNHLNSFILHNLAICYVILNDYETAIRYFKEALSYYKGSPVMLRTYSWLGYTLMKAARYEEGKHYFELADELLLTSKEYNPNSGDEYLNYLDISGHNYRWGCGLNILANLNKNSQALLRKSIDKLEMARKSREKERNYRRLVFVLDELGNVYWKANDKPKALLILEKAVDVSTKALGEDHAKTKEIKTKLEKMKMNKFEETKL